MLTASYKYISLIFNFPKILFEYLIRIFLIEL